MYTLAECHLEVKNCTFSDNYANYGGGISNEGEPSVTNCTFIGNSANGDGDGIFNDSSAVLTIFNTILADNGTQDLCNNNGTINSSFNIVETYAGFMPDGTDITGDQPGLNIGLFADNGSDTWTYALLPGSVAIDAGTASGSPSTDQRNVVRNSIPDIGAYEYHWPAIYVDSGALGANSGSSWSDAFTDLQDALSLAYSGDEIWVAKGTYKTDAGKDRRISFVLVDGVGLYGGFAGTETARDQRNWKTNTTTLSGDIGTEDDDSDNSYHVVKCGDVTGMTVLDGFTIYGGNADKIDPDNRGGGMYTTAKDNLEVNNCNFSDNYSLNEGGGLFNSGSPTVMNCTFSGNYASSGGWMYNDDSISTVTNCTFIQNRRFEHGHGSGIFNDGEAVLNIKNTILSDNVAEDLYNTATIVSSYNIVEFYTGFTPSATDITGDQPSLNIGPLADNGGDTWTHALLSDSVAINAGTASGVPSTDQRGSAMDALPDIGAYEYMSLALLVTIAADSINESDGASAATATIRRINTDTTNELIVLLSSSDPGEATVPETVVIPAEQNSATVYIDAVDDEVVDGIQTVTIAASATLFTSGADVIGVVDDDGEWWTEMAGATSVDLSSIWGASECDVFAVGDMGVVLHYDGDSWSSMESGAYENLTGVWGCSASEVYAVGESGAILRYDGESWSTMDSNTGEDLRSIWCDCESEVFAAGDSGTALYFDFDSWSVMYGEVDGSIHGVWGGSWNDIFFAGEDGAILNLYGDDWFAMNSGTASNIYGVWGSSGKDVFAVGESGTILHYEWEVIYVEPAEKCGDLVPCYKSIQTAIDEAKDKREIRIGAGFYPENIEIGKNVTLSISWPSDFSATGQPGTVYLTDE